MLSEKGKLGRMSCLFGYARYAFMFLFACNFLFLQAASADNKNEAQCSASNDYLIELARHSLSSNVETDYSCLTDLPSVIQKLPSFQLIDTRSYSTKNDYSKDVWLIPINDLKNKLFLQKKSLLLIDDSFSRVKAARNCAELKKMGFMSVKILLGGVNTWKNYRKNKIEQDRAVILDVNGQDFLFEYFNGHVIVVATSKSVEEKLKNMGFNKFFTVERGNQQKIIDIVLTQSNNGYDPVVIVDEGSDTDINIKSNFPNLYHLTGGILALRSQIEKNLWTDKNRTAPIEGGICAAK